MKAGQGRPPTAPPPKPPSPPAPMSSSSSRSALAWNSPSPSAPGPSHPSPPTPTQTSRSGPEQLSMAWKLLIFWQGRPPAPLPGSASARPHAPLPSLSVARCQSPSQAPSQAPSQTPHRGIMCGAAVAVRVQVDGGARAGRAPARACARRRARPRASDRACARPAHRVPDLPLCRTRFRVGFRVGAGPRPRRLTRLTATPAAVCREADSCGRKEGGEGECGRERESAAHCPVGEVVYHSICACRCWSRAISIMGSLGQKQANLIHSLSTVLKCFGDGDIQT